MNEQSPKKPDHWFIKKQGKVTGPFPVKLIGSYLILGRIDIDTLVSIDQEKWIPIGRLPSLIPDEIKNISSVEGKAQLHKAKLREDERRGDSRRDGSTRRATDRHDEDRRKAADRRQNDEKISASYLKLKADISAGRVKAKHGVIVGAVVMVALVAALVAGFLFTEPATNIQKTDCSVKAAKGIDWQSCNKSNINLVDAQLSNSNLHSTLLNGALLVNSQMNNANLSYANLESANLSRANLNGAKLVGTNLNNANLSGANLSAADLSYADLSNAIIVQVQVLNTRFDHVIWTDGRRCAKGSIDQCVFLADK